jgi:hypothetical protein
MASTKSAPSAATVAKLRREGNGWAAIRDATGSSFNSTRFAALLEEGGFGRDGLKLDGSGVKTTKARVRGSSNGKPKASAKKGSTSKAKSTGKASGAKATAKKGSGGRKVTVKRGGSTPRK